MAILLNRKRTQPYAAGCMGLFAIPFAAVGIGLAYLTFSNAAQEWRMRSWAQVPCIIEAAELIERPVDDGVDREVKAHYRYSVHGVEHTGSRVAIDPKVKAKTNFDIIETHRTAGKPITGYVNPANPADSILFRECSWTATLVQTCATLIFGGVGIGLLIGVFTHFVIVRTSEKLTADEPPWRRRPEWAGGTIRHSDWLKGNIPRWIGIIILAVSIPATWTSGRDLVEIGNPWAWLGLIPVFVGVIFFFVGHRRRRRWRRYGASVLQLTPFPGVVGQDLAGIVQVDRGVDSPDGFEVRCWCTETSKPADSDSTPDVRIIVDIQSTTNSTRTDGIGASIPISFTIPAEAPESADDPNEVMFAWRLSIRSLTPGADYFSEFEIPVFRTDFRVQP